MNDGEGALRPGRQRDGGDRSPLPVGPLLVVAVCVAALVGREVFAIAVGADHWLSSWSTVFVSIVLQALPFLGLGVVLAALVAVFVPDRVLQGALPRRAATAVPVATAAGALMPGCECGSVPFAGRMISRGVAPSTAVAFMLASPAVNPVVLVATAVAFPGQPMMVVARLVASAAVAILVGWWWSRWGTAAEDEPSDEPEVAVGEPAAEQPRRRVEFLRIVQFDVLQAGGFLVVGAALAATVNVLVPPGWAAALADVPVLSVLILAVLAVLVAICSEADAFVAAGLSGFSPTAQLAFMVVGPALDVKLAAMHVGTFGPRFAVRFAPLVFVVAVLVVLGVGGVLL